ncbi:hypothetical protein BDV97DRAFT_291031 [Delphinella strobiligena]|nr:hypothetical protein BDV97DRAFT_291031 [Delphinella strobiligena]
MPIRPATWADLAPAAILSANAFFDEDLLGPVMHPHRHIYRHDTSLFFLRQLRKDFFNPCCVMLVSHPIDAPLTVTGIAIWGRKGPGALALKATQSWRDWICAKLIPWLNRIEELFWPNRAADPEMVDVLERSYPFVAHYWQAPHRIENWYLQLCCTGPKVQGMGYGRELVLWGPQRAREEGVAASLIAAKGKEGFYAKCGFKGPVGWACEGEGNPIANVPGGAIMWLDVEEKR